MDDISGENTTTDPTQEFQYLRRNRAKSSHPYRNISIKDGFEEVRWRYPESAALGEMHVVDGTPFTGDITRAIPSRAGYKYPQRINHDGYYVVGQTCEQVWYESMTEYVALMQIEHSMSVASIASQPCCCLLRGEMAHYPDYAVRTAGGIIVIDVRDMHFTTLRDIAKFNRTGNLCKQLGWGYAVIEPLFGYERHNLVWLAGYRHWYAAPDADLAGRIIKLAADPTALMDLARELDANLGWRHLPAIFHLMFKRVLSYDGSRPLDDDTLIWKA
ncbi:TnsA-like heteromeric transposase endonuclease subunit [Pseudarthrobacter sp. NBSH8]|uniref:TnsA-like heteromeric transposase endonuclease subunit n=1 Tax=Pseudarthrobacter sp. NBSH8 TaxID=2596911 RepID=UPI0016261BCD|nr:TnsA-like heteromeric transposase endonuclease subunit [Pseudarthrobacter sp. NBSH8]QNE14855.1 TnsA-like heteromeric transposase endonuclease subunit [Pseudarthrobacter sp. NBSH8]